MARFYVGSTHCITSSCSSSRCRSSVLDECVVLCVVLGLLHCAQVVVQVFLALETKGAARRTDGGWRRDVFETTTRPAEVNLTSVVFTLPWRVRQTEHFWIKAELSEWAFLSSDECRPETFILAGSLRCPAVPEERKGPISYARCYGRRLDCVSFASTAVGVISGDNDDDARNTGSSW